MEDLLPCSVLSAALEGLCRCLGRARPATPSAAVLHRGEEVLAVAYADQGRGPLERLPRAPAQDLELFLVVEPDPADRFSDPSALQCVRIAHLNPSLGGTGVRRLQAEVPSVEVGIAVNAFSEALEPHFQALRLGRPHVLLKAATSLDGRIATRTGESRWITGAEARARGRRFRGEVDAIVAGVRTVLADDPALTTRVAGCSDPLRVVLDSRCRTPLDAQVVQSAGSTPTLVFTTAASSPEARENLSTSGVQVEIVPADGTGRVAISGLLARLFGLGVRTVLVEGGGQVTGAFLDGGWVDQVAWFIAPVVIGGVEARPAVGGRGVAHLAEALRLVDVAVERLGPDLLVRGRRGFATGQ